MLYNIRTFSLHTFPDRELLADQIKESMRGLQYGPNVDFEFQWLVPMDHNDNYLKVEDVLLRLRKSVKASVQLHIKEPRMFLHEIRDSHSIRLATLYSRYIRSLFVNCLSRLDPENDFVSLIQRGDYNCLYFARTQHSRDGLSTTIKVKAVLCPHVEPDWALDDFCRREVELYARDLYGDRCKPSLEEFVRHNELRDLTVSEIREFAYKASLFSSAAAWKTMPSDQIVALLYAAEHGNCKRYRMPMRDHLEILANRITDGNNHGLAFVEEAEAAYWFQVIGRDYVTAVKASKRKAFRSLLLTDVREYLEYAERH